MSREAGSLSAPTSRGYVIHQLKPQTKAKVQLPKCSLKRITFIVYTNASSQMPKSLPKPKKNCYQSSTLGRKKCHIFGTSTDLRGKKILICTRKDKKKTGLGCGSVIETQPYIPEALGFQPSAPETQNQNLYWLSGQSKHKPFHLCRVSDGELLLSQAGIFQSWRPVWSTELVPGQPGLLQWDPLSLATEQTLFLSDYGTSIAVANKLKGSSLPMTVWLMQVIASHSSRDP